MSSVPTSPAVSGSDFLLARAVVRRLTGNLLSDARWPAIEQRLLRRVRATGAASLAQYLQGFESAVADAERDHFVACVTTNETCFYREPAHFEVLAAALKSGPLATALAEGRRLRVWSAACSTGEEPWSLAMTLLEHAASPRLVRVLATDICADALRVAKHATYSAAAVRAVPPRVRGKYLREAAGWYQPSEELRSVVRFRRLNLVAEPFHFDSPVDVIFCRNVLIYFEPATVDALLDKFHRVLAADGYLFTGHAETLLGKQDQWEYVASTVYRRRAGSRADG